jgi:uncharacterized protein YPO0396
MTRCLRRAEGAHCSEQLEAIMAAAGTTAAQRREAQALLEQQHGEIARYAAAISADLEAKAALEAELEKMEARVLHGGENLVDKMSKLREMTKAASAELKAKRCAPPAGWSMHAQPNSQLTSLSLL